MIKLFIQGTKESDAPQEQRLGLCGDVEIES
jgi:hypothetical protein